MESFLRDLKTMTVENRREALWLNAIPYIMRPRGINLDTAFVKAHRDGNNVKWEYNFHEVEEEMSTTKTRNYVTEAYDRVYSIPHNMIATAFNRDATDERLDSVFAICNDQCDHLTPDIIIVEDDFIVVIEIGTTRAMNRGGMVAAYNMKIDKYASALRTRAERHDKIVFYIPVIVGFNMIASGLILPESLQKSCLFLFNIGTFIQNSVIPHSDLRKRMFDEDEQGRVEKLKDAFSKIEIPDVDETGYHFDKETYKFYSNYSGDKDYLEKFLPRFITTGEYPKSKNKQSCEEMMRVELEKWELSCNREDSRVDMKAPVQFPLMLPNIKKGTKPSFDENNITILKPNTIPIVEFWDQAMGQNLHQENHFEEEDTSVVIREAMLDEEDYLQGKEVKGGKVVNVNRRKWHRIEVKNLSQSVQESLACQGLNAKRYSKEENSIVIDHRERSKRGFSTSTDVSDIEFFLTDKEKYEYLNCSNYFPNIKAAKELIELADKMADNSNTGMKLVEKMMDTKLFVQLMTISVIATELAVSVKQNVKSREFVYKRVKNLDVEMLIHPTNSFSHVFFSIRFKGEVFHHPCFKAPYKYEDWYYFDFVSVNKSKITNLIKAPFTWLNSLLYWSFQLNAGEDCDKIKNGLFEESNSHSLELSSLTTLISLEDKAVTEEMVNGIRYISMQFFKGANKHSWPNPSKAISKLPTFMKSRLTVFLFKRISVYCQLQMGNLPYFNVSQFEREKEPQALIDNWVNLLDPLTHRETKMVSTVINIFYLGYGKNKDEKSNANSDYQMVKKILTYVYNEDKTKSDQYAGLAKTDHSKAFGPHEWSIEATKHSIDLFSEKIRMKLGDNYKESLTIHALKEILKRTHAESLATMKASALFKNFSKTINVQQLCQIREGEELTQLNIEEEKTKVKETMKKKKILTSILRKCYQSTSTNPMDEEYTRASVEKLEKEEEEREARETIKKSCKCMEAIVEELQSGLYDSPWMAFNMKEVIDVLSREWKGVCCYLFKKQQHGGLREIYVLTMKSRLVQCSIETAFRVLCSMADEETMTHPENKLTIIDSHQEEVSNHAMATRGKILTRQSAEDKQKWNQNNNVNMYAFIACQLFSEPLAKLIFKGLSLWRSKKIMIPEGVLNLLLTDYKINDNEDLEKLRREFWTGDGNIIKEKGSIFMETTTGMWQGILHYTSSFQHVLQTIHYKHLIRTTYYPLILKAGATLVDVITLVSSDDSMTKMSVVYPSSLNKSIVDYIDFLVSEALFRQETHASLFCMIESKKSVIASPTVGEFNSIFMIANGSFVPSIKPVLACLNMILTETLIKRQELYYNVLKDIFESGVSHFEVHCHQIVQSLFHYHSMGMCVNPIFNEWSLSLKVCPDPSLGFFVFEQELVCGLMGYHFAVYSSLINTNVPLMITYPKIIASGMHNKFNLSEKLFSSHGNRLKWRRFAKSVSVGNWEEEIEKNPRILYQKTTSKIDEALIKISVKASSGGIYESLSTANSISDLFSSSVYCLNTHSFTIATTDLSSENKETVYNRRSLYRVVTDSKQIMESVSHLKPSDSNKLLYNNIPVELKQVIFPNWPFYNQVLKIIQQIKTNFISAKCCLFRKSKNVIYLRTREINEPVPLIDVCRSLWFNMKGPYGKSLVSSSFLSYRRRAFPWLDKNPKTSIDKSNFTSQKQMFDFISSLGDRNVKSQPFCKRITSRIPSQQVMESIRYNFFHGYMFIEQKKPDDMKIFMRSKESRDVEEALDLQNYLLTFSSIINSFINFPCDTKEKDKLFREVAFSSQINADTLYKYNAPEKMRYVHAMHQSLIFPDNIAENMKLLTSCKEGIGLVYLREQVDRSKANRFLKKLHQDTKFLDEKDELAYYGVGEILLMTKYTVNIFHVYNNQLIAIETTNTRELTLEWEMIVSRLKQEDIQVDQSRCEIKSKQYRKCHQFNQMMSNYFLNKKQILDCVVTDATIKVITNSKDSSKYGIIPVKILSDQNRDLLETKLYDFETMIEFEDNHLEWSMVNRRTRRKTKLYRIFPLRINVVEEKVRKYFTKPAEARVSFVGKLLLNWVFFDSAETKDLIGFMKFLYLNRDDLEAIEGVEDLSKLKKWFGRMLLLRATFLGRLKSRKYIDHEVVNEIEAMRQNEGCKDIDRILKMGGLDYNIMLLMSSINISKAMPMDDILRNEEIEDDSREDPRDPLRNPIKTSTRIFKESGEMTTMSEGGEQGTNKKQKKKSEDSREKEEEDNERGTGKEKGKTLLGQMMAMGEDEIASSSDESDSESSSNNSWSEDLKLKGSESEEGIHEKKTEGDESHTEEKIRKEEDSTSAQSSQESQRQRKSSESSLASDMSFDQVKPEETSSSKLDSYINRRLERIKQNIRDPSIFADWIEACDAEEENERLKEEEERIKRYQSHFNSIRDSKRRVAGVSKIKTNNEFFQDLGKKIKTNYDTSMKGMKEESNLNFGFAENLIETGAYDGLENEAYMMLDPLSSRSNLRNLMMVHRLLDNLIFFLDKEGIWSIISEESNPSFKNVTLLRNVYWILDMEEPSHIDESVDLYNDAEFPEL